MEIDEGFLGRTTRRRMLFPQGVHTRAVKYGRITYDDSRLDYVDLRNQTTHTYDENLAEELYERLVEILGKFQLLQKSVRNKLS